MKRTLLLPLGDYWSFNEIYSKIAIKAYKNIVFCLILAFSMLSAFPANAQAPTGYSLAWSDEFNTTSLDTTLWKYRTGVAGTSYLKPENVVLENGKIRINLKKETYGGKAYTAGGIITKTPRRYGYYEVSVKIDGGYGWHEAFWSSWKSGFDDLNPAYDNMDKLEIDCFEHYADYANNYYTYGAIQWSPFTGNANRDYKTVAENLSSSYNVFGFEYTPDYLNYFYNGQLVKTVDTRKLPSHDLYLWLTCIANKPNATDSGAVFFDYLKCYEISPANYNLRKGPFIAHLDSLKLPLHSAAKDLWIEAEDFKNKKNWTKELDENMVVLKGYTQRDATRDSTELTAVTGIKIDSAGNYKLWVRSRDFTVGQGTRKFKVILNGQQVPGEFGNHGANGYAWQSAGTYYLPQGTTSLKLFDSSQNFARCDKFLLTSDTSFIPVGIGANSNVQHVAPSGSGEPFTPGNLVVLRIGDGLTALTSGNATSVFLDEYTSSGALVRSIPMPVAATGTNKRLTLSVSAADKTEGYLSRSPDGKFLALAGYDAAPGLAGVSTSASATVKRTIGIVDADGIVNTSTSLNTFSGVAIRSAVTSNGTDIWTTGGNNGIRYTTLGSATSIAITTPTARCLNIFNNQLYGSTTATNLRIAQIGTGMPVTAGQTMANLPGIATTSGSPYGIYMADLSSSVPEVDVMYVADEGTNALSKYSLVGGTWVLNGKIGTATDLYRGLTGKQNGAEVVLYATRKNSGLTIGGEIVSITDTTGYNVNFAAPQVVLVASAPANTIFRGIALAPDTITAQTFSMLKSPIKTPQEKSAVLRVFCSNGSDDLQIVVTSKTKLQGPLRIVNLITRNVVYTGNLKTEAEKSSSVIKVKNLVPGYYSAAYTTSLGLIYCKFSYQ